MDIFQKIGAYALRYPRRLFFCLILILFLISARSIVTFFWTKKHTPPALPVSLAIAKTQNVPVYLSALGTVSAEDTVNLKTQVNGLLMTQDVRDGEVVKAGQPIVHIDSRIYAAQLLQYEGALERDQALLANARIDLIRYQNLYKTHATSQQTLATQAALVQQDEGIVKMDEGQVQAAKTNLDYCTIIAPIDGRVGIISVKPGNFVQTSDANPIAVVTSLDPINVIFPLPAKELGAVSMPFVKGETLPVLAYDASFEKLIAVGRLIAIDNQVDVATGTVNFKALFANPKNLLFANQFVNIKIWIKTLNNAVIVPNTAIQQSSQGAYVYRYDPKTDQVHYVAVKTGATANENSVIESGLLSGDQVVTAGADKLFEGAHVLVSGNNKA